MAKAMSTSRGSSTEHADVRPVVQTPVGISPGKIANLRSNYLQQLRDLHSLLESGAINDKEFQEQKMPIGNFSPSYKESESAVALSK